MTERLLDVRDVTVSYRQPGLGRLTAVNTVSLALDRGQVLGLVGESGCGKSRSEERRVGKECPV